MWCGPGDLHDTDRIEWLARRWNSQGKGHHLMGHFFKNPTGSFRDAIDADILANNRDDRRRAPDSAQPNGA